jgi:hypothetical protein
VNSPLGLSLPDSGAIDSVARVMSAASSGQDLQVAQDLGSLLQRFPGALGLLVADARQVVECAGDLARDGVPVIALVDEIDLHVLAAAVRIPRLLGFVGRGGDGQLREWELAYLVRRVVSPQVPVPGTHELLTWGASTVTFRPRTTADLEQTVHAVETVSIRFGMSRRTAVMAADASHELLMNAMYDAPHDHAGRPKYANDRQAQVALAEDEVPTLRLTVDSTYLALDITDPFGRLARNKLYGGLLRAITGTTGPSAQAALDVSHGGAGLGLFKLYSTCTFLRAEVIPGHQTLVSWVVDRSVGGKAQRAAGRTIAYLEGT